MRKAPRRYALTSQIPNEVALRDRLQQVEREDKAVYLTLTRTATLTITTAGTIVTWQEEIDSCGKITWSGSSITVPVAGYYHLSMKGAFEVKDSTTGDVVVNGVEVATMGTGDGKDVKFRLNCVRFYKKGDVVQVKLTMASASHTLQVNTEDLASESPILHMVLI